MVTECSNISGLGDFFIMSPLGGCNGLAPGPGLAFDYFVINSTYPAASSNHANSVSTPCNNVTDTSIVAWTNGGQIYYKRSGFGGPTGYGYKTKPAPSGSPQGGETLRIFPNPADDHITVSNPADNAADRYSIKNVLGQIVKNGSMIADEQSIDVSRLANGSYIINFYKEGSPISNKTFVKK